jgi:hypothetical protein
VTVKGSARPITLYTLDIAEDEDNVRAAEKLDPSHGSLPEDEAAALELFTVQRAHAETPAAASADPTLLDAEREALEELEREVRTFRRTAAVYALRRSTSAEFVLLWDEATDLYFAGAWAEAHRLYSRCRELLPADGPTVNLIAYLERRELQPPPGWKGARAQPLERTAATCPPQRCPDPQPHPPDRGSHSRRSPACPSACPSARDPMVACPHPSLLRRVRCRCARAHVKMTRLAGRQRLATERDDDVRICSQLYISSAADAGKSECSMHHAQSQTL